ncbi:4598_t:CDS:2, partial [Racocetra persica]
MAAPTIECKEFFLLAEGLYTLKENIFLEINAQNLISGTLVSVVSVKYKEYTAHPNINAVEDVSTIDRVGENVSNNQATSSNENTLEVDLDEPTEIEKTQPNQQQLHAEAVAQNVDLSNSNLTSPQQPPTPSLSKSLTSNGSIPTSIEGKSDDVFSFLHVVKRKKTKNNLTKTTSSFVAKIIQNDNLTKILANRQNEDTYLFFNSGRTFCWIDLTNKPKDPLTKINFTKAHPICHDVNQLTRSCEHLDVVIGFSSGDIIWFDPLCNKYYRLNKQGIINNSSVTMVRWVPGSENLFMVSYQDGSVIIYDKEKDDQNFTPAVTNDEEG